MKIITLLTVNVVWGSTYLAVKIALESLPPFLMISLRLLIAGGMLYLVARARGAVTPQPSQWGRAGLVGFLLLVTGLGAVVWAEQTVPSGLAALLIATMPLQMMMLKWVGDGQAPTLISLLGLATGLAGVGLLLSSLGELTSEGPVPILGVGVVLLAALSWAGGSLLSRGPGLPDNATMSTGMQMLTAGLVLGVAGLLSGEQIAQVTLRSGAAFIYLTLMGSLVGFSAYMWLLKNCDPGLVSTYAYINPVIALCLGCWFGGEALGPTSLKACGITLVGVALIASESLFKFLPRAKRAWGSR